MIHTAAAVVALGGGAATLLRRKGTRSHRFLGHMYLWSMVTLNGTAFMLYGLLGRFGPFHVLALISLSTLVAGAAPAVARWPRGRWLEHHARFMAWSYAGLCAAAAAELAVRVPRVPFAAGVFVATASVIGASAFLIHGGGERRIRVAIRRGLRAAPVVALASGLSVAPLAGQHPARDPVPGHGLTEVSAALDRAVLRADPAGIAAAVRVFESAAESAGDEALALHYLGYARYRLAEQVPADSGDLRRRLRAGAREALEGSVSRAAMAESYALLAILTGIEMGDRPMAAMFLWRRWREELGRASELGPENPRVALLAAIGAFHAPAAFGGGSSRAEREILRAIELAAAETARPPAPRWGAAEALFWLGRVRERQQRRDEARDAYRRAVALEPEYAWAMARLRRLDAASAPGAPGR